ncbi:MAG: hypothetical protein AAGF66_04740 [Cyanobacteria bacterium P01_H01_bin.119]
MKVLAFAGLAIALSAVIPALQLSRLKQLASTDGVLTSPQQELARQEEGLKQNLTATSQLPDFGYSNLFANFSYLSFLQYFGNRDVREVVGYTNNPQFFENIVARDPRFTHIYFYLSFAVSIYAASPEISVALMEQGLQSMTPTNPTDSFYVWRYKATDELLFLGNGEAARQSHLMATDWARQSPLPESQEVAERSLNTAEFLAQDVNSKPAQISAWAQVLSSAIDSKTQQIAVDAIEALGGEILVSETGNATVRYQVIPDENESLSEQE